MTIELTDEQRRAVEQGKPVEVVDPATVRTFVVLAREEYERVRSLLETVPRQEVRAARAAIASPIPPGIRRSQEAYWRDLPKLLKRKSRSRRWVGYHGDERIGFGATSAEVYQKCLRRGLQNDEFYVDRLEPRPLPPWEAEEIEAPFAHSEGTVERSSEPSS
jgi:hypothetical protein